LDQDARQLFLVNGFDQNKKVFYIINGEHNWTRNKNYQPFVIPFATLTELYILFNQRIADGYLCTVEKGEKIDFFHLVNECLYLFLQKSMRQPYRELTYVERIQKHILHPDEPRTKDLDILFLRTIKYKGLFYSLLSSLISNFWDNKTFVAEMDQNKKQIMEGWEKVRDTSILGLHLKRKFTVDDKVKAVLQHEEHMQNMIESATAVPPS
jgi:hypothetical protein